MREPSTISDAAIGSGQACAPPAMAAAGEASRWTAAGFAALAMAIAAAGLAQDPAASSEIGAHLVLCLSGQTPGETTQAGFLGHCVACWAAVALSVGGALALALARVSQPPQR